MIFISLLFIKNLYNKLLYSILTLYILSVDRYCSVTHTISILQWPIKTVRSDSDLVVMNREVWPEPLG